MHAVQIEPVKIYRKHINAMHVINDLLIDSWCIVILKKFIISHPIELESNPAQELNVTLNSMMTFIRHTKEKEEEKKK